MEETYLIKLMKIRLCGTLFVSQSIPTNLERLNTRILLLLLIVSEKIACNFEKV